MRRHAKASTAGSTQRQAGGLGRFLGGVGAARGASLDAKGSSARAARRLALPAGVFAALIALLVVAMPASASKVHQFASSFGSAGSGSSQFSANKGIAVDQSDGSLYVVDSGNFRVQKFNPAGNFVLAFGKGVDQTTTGDVCTAASGDTCRAGTQGSGGSGFDTNNGFSNPTFVAIDPNNGDVYVADSGTSVVDKFSSAGAFVSSNDGSGSGASFGSLAGIAVDSSRNLWVYDEGAQMREFDDAGAFLGQWNSGFGVSAAGIAVDSSTDLYVVRGSTAVERFSSAGTDLGEVNSGGTASLAIDPATDDLYVGVGAEIERYAGGCSTPCSSTESFGSGNVTNTAGVAVRGSTATTYVSDPGKPGVEIFNSAVIPDVATGPASGIEPTSATLNGTVNPDGVELSECKFEYGTTTGYGQSAPCAESPATIGTGSSPVSVHADLSGLMLGAEYHFRLVAKNPSGTVNGSDSAFKLKSPPVIGEEWSAGVAFHEATLKAQIDPEGFATTYRFEWGPTAAYGNDTSESGVGSDKAAHEVSSFLEGLSQGTTYHYRVTATNSIGTSHGADHTFTTFTPTQPDTDCPNRALRIGPSADLPDCRAYEMVTPVDKNGGDGWWAGLNQSSLNGDKLAYSSPAAFGDILGNYQVNEYLASRGEDGWSSHSLMPPAVNAHLNTNADWFEAFTPDLSSGWLKNNNEVPLTPDAQPGDENLYRRDNTTGSYEALTNTVPIHTNVEKTLAYAFLGSSSDGRHTFFDSVSALTPDSSLAGERQIYDFSGGTLHLVSVLPDGTAYSGDAEAGAAHTESFWSLVKYGKTDVHHTYSEDGSRIFWTALPSHASVGTLYVRENPAAPQSALNGSGECTEPAKACTVKLGDETRFLTATPDGSEVLVEKSGNLSIIDVDTLASTPIAGEIIENVGPHPMHADGGVIGAAEDLSRVYFVSREALAPGATAGQRNLYLDHDGTKTYIATLSALDVGELDSPGFEGYPTPVSLEPRRRDSRVSPSGRRLVFTSNQSLTGYDNTDAVSGKADLEVYQYDADADQLTCISCNPSGARPVGDLLRVPYEPFEEPVGVGFPPATIPTAASLPTSEDGIYSQNALSADGNRVFFESFDALLPQDTNGAQDVYEWEAQGTGDCQKADGCLSLISTGKSPRPSGFVDASPDGSDVFIHTLSGIDPRDPGQVDIYDARVNGGFPLPPGPPACEGDACQSVPAAPNDPTPASAGFRGPGNPQSKKARHRRCRARGHHQGKRAKRKAAKRCRGAKRRARR